MSLLSRISEAVGVLATDDGPLQLGIHALAPGEFTLANPAPWANYFGGGPTGAGKVVTAENASRFTAVAACVRVLEHAVGQIPCVMMRKLKDGGVEPAMDHPLYDLTLNLQNPEITAQTGRELAMNHLCYRGTAYTQIVRNNADQVVELNPLDPDLMRMERNEAGSLVYKYTTPGRTFDFASDEIWRVVGETNNGINGISLITKNREAIGLGIAAEEHGAKLFANGAQMATAFEHPSKMSPESYARLRDSISQRYSGSQNAFRSIILEDGIKVSKLAMTNVDSQFIELRKFQIEEICRIFLVPPHKIQHLDRATFNNIEHLSMDFVNSSLMPWLVRFSSTMYRDLLRPNERKRYFWRFDFEALIQGDMAAQANFYASAISNRWMNPNEVRIKRGLNPYAGGEKFENPNTTSDKQQPGKPIPDPQKG